MSNEINICSKCSSILKLKPPKQTPVNCITCFNLLQQTNIHEKVLSSLQNYEIRNTLKLNKNIEYNITLPCEIIFIIHSLQEYYKNDKEHSILPTIDQCIKDMKECLIETIHSKILELCDEKEEINNDVQQQIGIMEVRIVIECSNEFKNLPNEFLDKSNIRKNKYNNQYQKPHALYTRTSIYKGVSKEDVSSEAISWFKSYQAKNEVPTYDIQVTTRRKSFYVIGYYNKLKRNISQTPFFKEDVAPTSVSSTIIRNISCLFYKDNTNITENEMKFHGSGREDLDVRMLNNGRKFGIEIVNATKAIPTKVSIKKHLQSVYDEMTIQGVTIVNSSLDVLHGDSSIFSNLQSETEEKTKEYICLCWSQTAYSKEGLEDVFIYKQTYPLKIQQQTPLRVLHRRSNLKREKIIHTLHVKWLNPHWFLMTVKTSGGTYVKEFVHGDLGRTVPSVFSILNGKGGCGCARVDIMQLDVLNVEDERE